FEKFLGRIESKTFHFSSNSGAEFVNTSLAGSSTARLTTICLPESQPRAVASRRRVSLGMARTVESALQFEYSHTVTPLAYFLIGLAFVLGLGVALFLVRQAKAQMSEHFKSLSFDVLQSNSKTFVEIAKGELEKAQLSVKGDLDQRREAINALVEPLKQQLETYQKRLQHNETAQASALGEVKNQLELLSQQSLSLANETQQFRMVLHSSQARGRWGDETLRRVVEAAGMSVHCDFVEQMVAGDAKPDLIVRLPYDRVIIVDSKVPDLDFLSALHTADAPTRANFLAAHARKLKDTIK